MPKRRLRGCPPVQVSFVALAGIALFAGCSSNWSNHNSRGLPCGAPQGQVVLVYPAPGSTGIPDNLPGIVFGSTNGLSFSYNALVQPAGSSAAFFGLVVTAPSPLPSPYTTSSFASPIYQESGSNGIILPAATLQSVYLNDANSNCTPTLLGTFTSQ